MYHFIPSSRYLERLNAYACIKQLTVSIAFCLICQAAYASDTKELIKAGEQRIKAGQSAQKSIDSIDDKNKTIEAEFLQVINATEGIQTYNEVLGSQVEQQEQEIGQLKESIQNSAEIERQILPLIMRMIDSLEQFIKADAPFLLQERTKRVSELKALMRRADVSRAEQLNQVIEAYKEEMRYGHTLEAYPGQVELDGLSQNVEYLRIGRVGLIYQSLDSKRLGAWNRASESWQALDAQAYSRYVRQGLKIARKQAAPDFLMTPVFNTAEASLGAEQ